MGTELERINKITLPDVPNNEVAIRNRHILMEAMSGKPQEAIAMRYGVTQDEIMDCMRCALDDIKATDFRRDLRLQLATNLMNDLLEIQQWEAQLSPKYKREYESMSPTGKVKTLTEDTDDKLIFIKYKAEKRALYQQLKVLLGADLPEEAVDAKAELQNKMMDVLLGVIDLKQEKKEVRVIEVIDIKPE